MTEDHTCPSIVFILRTRWHADANGSPIKVIDVTSDLARIRSVIRMTSLALASTAYSHYNTAYTLRTTTERTIGLSALGGYPQGFVHLHVHMDSPICLLTA